MGSSDIDKWIGDARDSTVSFFNDHVEQPVYSFFPLTFPLAHFLPFEKSMKSSHQNSSLTLIQCEEDFGKIVNSVSLIIMPFGI